MRIVLLGPPGVGKGTQGRRLAAEYGGALISTGEILRGAVSRATPLGLEARKQMDRGLLVADDVMVGLVRERTLEPDAVKAFVLDGFPRTIPQATALDELLAERGLALCAVVSMTAATDELVRRLSARRECPVCKRAYNAVSAPSRDGVHCDDHADTALVHRADDAEETIRRRLEVYAAQTAPLVGHYRDLRRLVEVDGMGETDGVYQGLKSAIDTVRAAR